MTIKEARLAAGLTQKSMSELFGIPKRTIESWESAEDKPNGRRCPEWAERLIIEKLQTIAAEKK